MTGGDCRCYPPYPEWYRIDESKLYLKGGGGGSKKKLHKDKGGQWENKYIPLLSCTDLYYEKYTITPQPPTHIYTGISPYDKFK